MNSDLMNRAMALLAIVLLAGFVAILIVYVPRWDLGIMASLTVVLAAWDFWHTATGRTENKH